MSYIVIKVYSFECDWCGMICEVTPRPDKHIMLRDAHAELRDSGWSVIRSGASWVHRCDKHATEVMPHEPLAAS